MFDVIVDVHMSRSSRKTLQWKQLPVGVTSKSYFQVSSKFTCKSLWKNNFSVQLHA